MYCIYLLHNVSLSVMMSIKTCCNSISRMSKPTSTTNQSQIIITIIIIFIISIIINSS